MMAADLHNRDSLFHTSVESEFFSEEKNRIKPMNNKSWSSCFCSSDFGSVFSSPVESEEGSTESESDQDDDDIGELTRQMAHYMLQDHENKRENKSLAYPLESTKWPKLGTSEKEVAAMKNKFDKKPTNLNLEFHSGQALIDQQIRAIQLMKQQQQESFYWAKQANNYRQPFYGSKGRPCNGQKVGSWVNPQQQQIRTGPEMTAVFLGESGSRTGSCGTGVFLPRGISNPCDLRKKSGCSTVLIPARVVHALKHHMDKVSFESRSNGAICTLQNGGMMGRLSHGLVEIESQSQSLSQTVPAMNHQEIGLPQEWTY